jgi:hypothetical protein
VCFFGMASAQETAKPPEVVAQQDVNLSPKEMVTRAESFLPEMERGASGVRRQLSAAREQHDVVKVLCLNDKLNQIDVAIRSAQERMQNLRASATGTNSDVSRHEFTVLQVLKERARSLVAEANQCIGEEVGFIGETQVVVDIDPNIPDDPSDFPDDPLISQPPVLSSPTS